MESDIAKPIRHRDKWRIRWIDADGNRRSEVFEDYSDAVRALRGRQVEADEIRAGTRAKRPEDRTFAELCDHWLDTRGATKRSSKDDRSMCKRLRTFFGDDRLLREIGVEDVDAYVDEHDDLSPKTLANHVTLLITMMNYAASFREPWIAKVPRFKKPKIAALGRNYSYLQTRALEIEARRIATKAEEAGDTRTALAAIRELTRIVELQAKLAGQLSDAPVVAVHVSGEWATLRARILDVLDRFPPARVAVLEAIAGDA